MCRQSRVSAVSEAVAFSADGDGGGVMEESIQQRGGQDVIALVRPVKVRPHPAIA